MRQKFAIHLIFRNTNCIAIDHCTSREQMKRVDTQGSRNRKKCACIAHPFLALAQIFFISHVHSVRCSSVFFSARAMKFAPIFIQNCVQKRKTLPGQCHVTWKWGLHTVFIVIACSRYLRLCVAFARAHSAQKIAIMCIGWHEAVPSFRLRYG